MSVMIERLEGMVNRYHEINEMMMSPEIVTDSRMLAKLGREQADLTQVVETYTEYKNSVSALEDAKALLLARSGSADVREVRAAAASAPDDVEAQLAVADIDMIGGQIQDAFDRLLDFLAAGHKGDLEAVRQRLLEYFTIPEPTDPRLARARRRLATLMY